MVKEQEARVDEAELWTVRRAEHLQHTLAEARDDLTPEDIAVLRSFEALVRRYPPPETGDGRRRPSGDPAGGP